MVRKIKAKSSGVRIRFYSAKQNRTVMCESLLEKDFCLYMEFQPEVVSYKEQPFRVEEINYVPDFLVLYRSGKEAVYEVKPSEILKEPAVNERLFKAKNILKEKGYEFEVFTENSISWTRLKNYEFIYRFHRKPSHYNTYESHLLESISEGPLSVQELLERFSQAEKPLVLPVLWHMIYKGKLKTDLDSPLSNRSIIHA